VTVVLASLVDFVISSTADAAAPDSLTGLVSFSLCTTCFGASSFFSVCFSEILMDFSTSFSLANFSETETLDSFSEFLSDVTPEIFSALALISALTFYSNSLVALDFSKAFSFMLFAISISFFALASASLASAVSFLALAISSDWCFSAST